MDTICSDSNTLRKQIASNRKALGASQCKNLPPPPMRSGPTASDLQMPALYGEKKLKPVLAAAQVYAPRPQVAKARLGVAAAMPGEGSACEMSSDEFAQVRKGSVDYLNHPESVRNPCKFLSYLTVATLCYGFAPRQQVLRQLRLDSSFVKKADGFYHVVMLAHMNKNNKATTFPLPAVLTKTFDLYLDTVRPRLLGAKNHEYVFCKQSGDAPSPTFDFSDWTRSVTKELLGKPINAS